MSISTDRVDLSEAVGFSSSSFRVAEAREKPFLTNFDGFSSASRTYANMTMQSWCAS